MQETQQHCLLFYIIQYCLLLHEFLFTCVCHGIFICFVICQLCTKEVQCMLQLKTGGVCVFPWSTSTVHAAMCKIKVIYVHLQFISHCCVKRIASCCCVIQSHYTKDYTQVGAVLNFQQVFAIMFNGCTGIMGKPPRLITCSLITHSIDYSLYCHYVLSSMHCVWCGCASLKCIF